jgi:hypothetical protein
MLEVLCVLELLLLDNGIATMNSETVFSVTHVVIKSDNKPLISDENVLLQNKHSKTIHSIHSTFFFNYQRLLYL